MGGGVSYNSHVQWTIIKHAHWSFRKESAVYRFHAERRNLFVSVAQIYVPTYLFGTEETVEINPALRFLTLYCPRVRVSMTDIVNVKCTLVQALRLCTGRTSQKRSWGIALLFLDHGTRREWGVNVTPRPHLPPGKTRYPFYRKLGGPQGRSGQVRKISSPPGFDPRTVQPVTSGYTDWATGPTRCCKEMAK